MDIERKLVSIRTINNLAPIPGADVIEVATIDGWELVVKKGEFSVGDSCLYFEIDSFLPESDRRYAFLMRNGTREYEGIKGHKLKTIKLKGQLSQGLALPLTQFPEFVNLSVGDNVTEILGIKKWEPNYMGRDSKPKGNFPEFIRKTDQERCQNMVRDIFIKNIESLYEISLKLDGTSVTYYHNNGHVGACSRNLELKIEEDTKNSLRIAPLINSGLYAAISQIGNIAIQGELMGPSIQKNREGFTNHRYYIFDMQYIDTQTYLTPIERHDIIERLYKLNVNRDMIQHVPILNMNVSLSDLNISDVKDLLKFAEGPSINHPIREGLVFKRMDGIFSFKSISNTFLMKDKE